MTKYYAVKKGRQSGIYSSWTQAQKQVSGYSGAQFKSFVTKADAEEYLNGSNDQSRQKPLDVNVVVYTDGGSRNTGNKKNQHVKSSDRSAWAYLMLTTNQKFVGTSGEWGATNNRMEIMALLSALKRLLKLNFQNKKILVVSDSHYVLDSINNKWLWGWQKRGWKTSNGSKVKNQELWAEMIQLLPQFPHLVLNWTKGHANNSGNIFVDGLLNQTMDKMDDQQDKQVKPTVFKEKNEESVPDDQLISTSSNSEITKKSVTSVLSSLEKLGINVNIK